MALKEHGAGKFGRLIDQNIDQACHLAGLIVAHPPLELVAPQNINIVCFRFNPGGMEEEPLKALNREIMLRLQ
jgi:glutamate/tyrosine decarboxylase-like PLP-dependent enzyme